MAWFSISSSAPDVVASSEYQIKRFWATNNLGGWRLYASTETTNTREVRGMTKAAADSKVTALLADTSVADVRIAAIGGGGYNVQYVRRTQDTWADVT